MRFDRWLPSLNERDRRALRLLAVAMVPALVFQLAVRPFLRSRVALVDEIATQRDLLARERGLVADVRGYSSRLDRVGVVMRAEASRLFRAADDVSGTAALGAYVTDRATASRVVVRQIEMRPADSTVTGLTGLSVEIRAEGDLEGMMAFLRALETGPRLVRVERLTLERVDSRVAGQETLTLGAMVRAYAPRPALVRAQ